MAYCRLYAILSRLVGFFKNERLRCSSGCASWSELGLLDNVRQLKIKDCAQQMVREHSSFGFFDPYLQIPQMSLWEVQAETWMNSNLPSNEDDMLNS